MIGILRFIGLINAAIWFGGSVYLMVLLTSGIFSPEMEALLREGYKFYSGAVAQIAFERFFRLQLWCAIVAGLHLLAVWLYLGRPLHRVTVWIVVSLFAFSLLADFYLQPKMHRLQRAIYATQISPEARDSAKKSFGRWHGFAQAVNVLVLGSLVVYLWRISLPPDGPRFVSSTKFRG